MSSSIFGSRRREIENSLFDYQRQLTVDDSSDGDYSRFELEFKKTSKSKPVTSKGTTQTSTTDAQPTFLSIEDLIAIFVITVIIIGVIFFILRRFLNKSNSEKANRMRMMIESDKMISKSAIGNSIVSLDSAKFLNFKPTKMEDNKFFNVSFKHH